MWPWEHLLLGYLLYSLFANLRYRDSPTGGESLAVVLGTQLPDLIDKPLSWTLGITETGASIGHSIFAAPVFILASYLTARRLGNPRLAMAFAIAHLSHLLSDILYPIVLGRGIEPRVVLWPVTTPPPLPLDGGLFDHFFWYFGHFLARVTTGELTPYVTFQIALALTVLVLWLYDGAPVAADIYRRLTGLERDDPE